MRIKVSDYIANFLVEHHVNTVFTVVGGGAMHMNDSFGHHSDIKCIYNHHEQASGMAAEAFWRINRQMAAVCVTSGPGAINALNGVAGAYMDSIPMLVFSGQTKSTMTVKSSGLKLRTLGNQEFDIVSTLENVAKYYEMIEDPKRVRYCLERMLYEATTGRSGPTWLDVPLDIQGSYVESEELEGFNPPKDTGLDTEDAIRTKVIDIIERLDGARRPVLYAGNGIRIAGAEKLMHQVVEKLDIPSVTCWDSIDLFETEDAHYTGRGGTMGDRAGNFAVQNSDLLICVGSRLNIYQVGYNVNTWAREAFIVDVDIDSEELKKPTIRVDMPICCDAADFFRILLEEYNKVSTKADRREWIDQCNEWKKKYPVVTVKHYEQKEFTNVYAFVDTLSRRIPENGITVVANGSASVVGSQSYYIKRDCRFIMNCGMSSMGYDLPAAVGACVANGIAPIVCIAGDGSIQMNIQELQTIVTNKLPVKLFIINNGGYHQIRQTQNNIFHNGLIGVGPESGDLGFPDFEKLSGAYGIPYARIENNTELNKVIDTVLESNSYYLCEVFCDTKQVFEPKSATKKLPDGSLYSPPLEDMAPFLKRQELEDNMYIPLL